MTDGMNTDFHQSRFPLIFSKIKFFLNAIKFEESVFALPFAYMGMMLAGHGFPKVDVFVMISVAMVSARTVGMIANRVIDQKIDAKNPRTSGRHLPTGQLKTIELMVPGTVSLIIFIITAWQLNTLALVLSPFALAYLIMYPYAKRFTWSANIILGWALAMAPSAAWIAVTGTLAWPPVLLSLSVALWAGSFDIIYHTQDIEFQRRENLHSIPTKFGLVASFRIAQTMDVLAVVCLVGLGAWLELNILYFISCIISACLLWYKFRLVKVENLKGISMSFMRINPMVSITMLVGTILTIYLTP